MKLFADKLTIFSFLLISLFPLDLAFSQDSETLEGIEEIEYNKKIHLVILDIVNNISKYSKWTEIKRKWNILAEIALKTRFWNSWEKWSKIIISNNLEFVKKK